MMNITEKRIISAADVRNLCIVKDWYTNGSTDDYRSMLDYVKACENVTTADIHPYRPRHQKPQRNRIRTNQHLL